MTSLLKLCLNIPLTEIGDGEIVIEENSRSNTLVVLAEGTLEVYRGDVSIAIVDEPGALFGEMSVLLNCPHTANVRAVSDAKVHIVDGAKDFLAANPAFLLPVAKLLARRLHNSTSYLVDLKRQFEDRSDHFAMVDEVLESLAHEQDESFIADPDQADGP
ncbi:MAG: cyclic nucleotide-binding domain-containing protein [Pseudomonadota bacterium]